MRLLQWLFVVFFFQSGQSDHFVPNAKLVTHAKIIQKVLPFNLSPQFDLLKCLFGFQASCLFIFGTMRLVFRKLEIPHKGPILIFDVLVRKRSSSSRVPFGLFRHCASSKFLFKHSFLKPIKFFPIPKILPSENSTSEKL